MNQSAEAAAPGPLTQSQISQFVRDGFVVVGGLFGPERVAELQAWTTEIQNWPEVPGAHMMYFETALDDPGRRVLNRVEDVVSHHAGMKDLMTCREMIGAVAQLFGEPAILFKDKINFKMPGGDGFAAHQDVQAGWDRYGSLHITAMVAIDPCTEDNGCLEFAPAAHDRGLIGSQWKPLSDTELSDEAYRKLPMAPGDAVFFDSYAPHRSAPNHTDRPRRILYFTYGRASDGDQRERYYADKRDSYPPDIEREPGKNYVFRV